ncbi:histidine kinase [Nitrosopumilus sp.]|uniref:histidine kinase n=1 Tax=Nitrosopumilus sp. TaxID=2024843 RepID=UPI002637C784|nr:histidine kinase [Nitrosopumilus sp.]
MSERKEEPEMDPNEVPEVVPEKIKSPFDYKAIIGIAILVISFHVITNYFVDPDSSDLIVSIFSFINPLIVAIIGFYVASRYGKSQVFGKANLALAGGFLSIFLAEVTYMLYDIVYNIEPYPSIADVFFFMLYPLLLVYLFLNIKFFIPKLSKKAKVWIAIMPLIVLLGYSILSTTEGEISIFEFDFYYGVIFVYIVTLTLAVAVVGAINLKEGVIGKAWIVLVSGILLLTMGDIWYYNLELFEGYDLTHPVNMFWYAGYWGITYALIKHKKII